jgi:hypothetical protein
MKKIILTIAVMLAFKIASAQLPSIVYKGYTVNKVLVFTDTNNVKYHKAYITAIAKIGGDTANILPVITFDVEVSSISTITLDSMDRQRINEVTQAIANKYD